MWRPQLAALVLVSVLLPSACGGGGDGGDGGDAAASSTDAAGTVTAEPSPTSPADGSDPASPEPGTDVVPLGEVTVVRDEAAGVEATIGIAGGSLEVTSGDGAVWRLDVPEGALSTDTVIRAVPATLDGVPFPAWTLMFEPSGLFFNDFATLSVTTPVDVPVAEQFPFLLDDEGTTFAASPVVFDSADPVLLVGHFSGYGLAKATPTDRAALLERGASEAEARISARFAELFSDLRRAALLGESQPEGTDEIMAGLIAEFRSEVVQPRLEAAGASCEATTRAVQTVLSFGRQTQLLGYGDVADAPTTDIITSAYSPGGPCEEEAIRQCQAAQDPGILLSFFLLRERVAGLLGTPSGGASIADLMKEAERICRPATYRLDALWGDFALTGSICVVGEPFRVAADAGYGALTMDFSWSNDTGGVIGFTGDVEGAEITGTGTFVVATTDQGATLSIETEGTGSMGGFTVPAFVDTATFDLTLGGDCS